MVLDRFNPGTMPGYQALFVIDPALRQNNSKNSRGLPPANSSGNSNCGRNRRVFSKTIYSPAPWLCTCASCSSHYAD
jgi:hypothetical protein